MILKVTISGWTPEYESQTSSNNFVAFSSCSNLNDISISLLKVVISGATFDSCIFVRIL